MARFEDLGKEPGKIVQSTPGQKVTIHNVHILDASGSMQGGKYKNAIEGINTEMEKLKGSDDANYTQTVVEFTSMLRGRGESKPYTVHYVMAPMAMVNQFKGIGANGGTPLLETTGEVIELLLSKVKAEDRVLITIFTDGEENDSHGIYADPKVLTNLMERVKTHNNFTITFMGTERDVEHMVKDFGISRGNTFTHMNTADSINTAYMARTSSVNLYSKGMASGQSVSENFFSKEMPEDAITQTSPPDTTKKTTKKQK